MMCNVNKISKEPSALQVTSYLLSEKVSVRSSSMRLKTHPQNYSMDKGYARSSLPRKVQVAGYMGARNRPVEDVSSSARGYAAAMIATVFASVDEEGKVAVVFWL